MSNLQKSNINNINPEDVPFVIRETFYEQQTKMFTFTTMGILIVCFIYFSFYTTYEKNYKHLLATQDNLECVVKENYGPDQYLFLTSERYDNKILPNDYVNKFSNNKNIKKIIMFNHYNKIPIEYIMVFTQSGESIKYDNTNIVYSHTKDNGHEYTIYFQKPIVLDTFHVHVKNDQDEPSYKVYINVIDVYGTIIWKYTGQVWRNWTNFYLHNTQRKIQRLPYIIRPDKYINPTYIINGDMSLILSQNEETYI